MAAADNLPPPGIFTIGHGKHDWETLQGLLGVQSITCQVNNLHFQEQPVWRLG